MVEVELSLRMAYVILTSHVTSFAFSISGSKVKVWLMSIQKYVRLSRHTNNRYCSFPTGYSTRQKSVDILIVVKLLLLTLRINSLGIQ